MIQSQITQLKNNYKNLTSKLYDSKKKSTTYNK